MGKEIIQFSIMEKKNDYIKVRLTKEEKLRWQEKAVNSGLSLSNLIRLSVERSKTPTIENKQEIAALTRQVRRVGINLNQIAKWANTYGSTAEAIEIIECLRAIETKLNEISSFPSAPVGDE